MSRRRHFENTMPRACARHPSVGGLAGSSKNRVISAEPALGLQFGSAPVVAADGTQIEVRVFIAPDAPLGARVIRVRTRTGISAAEAGSANTFTVYSP